MANSAWSQPPNLLTLAPDAVHIWRAVIDASPQEVQSLQYLLSADELERAERFRFTRDRQQFVVTRAALRCLLGAYTQQKAEQLRFTYNSHGKPLLVQPQGQEPLCFNLSHGGGLALIAVGWRRALGVDLAPIDTTIATMQIAARFFAPSEYARLSSLPPDEQTPAFFRAWARKEAYIKACGVGLAMALDRFVVTLGPTEPAMLLYVADDPAEAARWSLQSLDLGPGYQAALVVEGHDWRPSYWQWHSLWGASSAQQHSGDALRALPPEREATAH